MPFTFSLPKGDQTEDFLKGVEFAANQIKKNVDAASSEETGRQKLSRFSLLSDALKKLARGQEKRIAWREVTVFKTATRFSSKGG